MCHKFRARPLGEHRCPAGCITLHFMVAGRNVTTKTQHEKIGPGNKPSKEKIIARSEDGN